MQTLRSKQLLLIVAALLFLGGGAYAWLGGKAEDKAQQQESETVSRGAIEETVTAVGTLEPKDYVDVGAQVSGQIKKLYVDIGYAVKAGDLLAEIDPKVYQSVMDGDQANLSSLEAQLVQQKAQTDFDRLQFERAQKLVETKAISQEEIETKDKALKIADAAIVSLEAKIMQAKAALDKDIINLGYTKIYAPMDGVVSDRKAREGQTLNANQTTPTIVQIANLGVMTIRAEIAEADVMRLKPDMAATFTTMGGNDRVWQGKVRQILPTPEVVNDVVLYNALIDVENTDGSLMNGMSAQAKFIVAKADNVLRLPPRALGLRLNAQDNEKGKAYQVQVLTRGEPKARTVWVGLMTRGYAEVREGLSEGDQVLVSSAASGAGNGKKSERMLPPSMGARL